MITGIQGKDIIGPICVVVGWLLATMTRYFEEVLFGAKLIIDCPEPGSRDEDADEVYMKFRVRNNTRHHVAKKCRAYLVAIHKVGNGKVKPDNLISDTFQLPWAGYDFEPRDLPAKVSQYVDLVRFSKQVPGWKFVTKPNFYPSLAALAKHKGIYRFTIVAAGDGATPQERFIYVEYEGEWTTASIETKL